MHHPCFSPISFSHGAGLWAPSPPGPCIPASASIPASQLLSHIVPGSAPVSCTLDSAQLPYPPTAGRGKPPSTPGLVTGRRAHTQPFVPGYAAPQLPHHYPPTAGRGTRTRPGAPIASSAWYRLKRNVVVPSRDPMAPSLQPQPRGPTASGQNAVGASVLCSPAVFVLRHAPKFPRPMTHADHAYPPTAGRGTRPRVPSPPAPGAA